MRYGSICSGIEAASIAWEPLGWEPAFFSEIEEAPRTVLNYQWPDVSLHGDFTTIKGDEYGPIDILVGGTPCQSFSVAGLRKGLDDDRGNLSLEFLRLAERTRPRWVVWENVGGVLSSVNHDAPDLSPPEICLGVGRDGEELELEDHYDTEEIHAFNCFLSGLSEIGFQYAYRLFDAQYFGLAQRRKRLFVIGYSGRDIHPAAVLFERQSLSRSSKPRREDKTDVANCLRGQPQSSHRADTDNFIPTSHWEGGPHPALSQSNSTGGIGMFDQELFSQKGAGLVCADIANILETTCGDYSKADGMNLIAFDCKASGQQGFGVGEISPTLRAMNGEKVNGGGQIAIAFAENSAGEVRLENGDGQIIGTLSAGGGKLGQGYPAIATRKAVRKLTPVECERLQGIPDNHTLVPWKKNLKVDKDFALYIASKNIEEVHVWEKNGVWYTNAMPDGHRYKMIGNSMPATVMRWVGQRIKMAEQAVEAAE